MASTPDESPSAAPDRAVPRLVVSWSIVGVPLIYGVVETVRAILPLFGG
ncbi:hypothetical protein AB0C84_30980 [Actinomadura sp. NPDC048955]|uniref:Uncharacterized protein n=1 Tax=Actinomadura luteofluorescens TaxID=46163 RepID=A0A7Y9ENU6_9ACTN|nr:MULTISPECIES: hypothetical protein [Actinomadura]MCR3741995.1 hypothetical protein [Actinomadura glauciflava]NYD51149.1 hypothetical protein [Actinomadura luteofluorescens]